MTHTLHPEIEADLQQLCIDIYNRYSDEKYFGIYSKEKQEVLDIQAIIEESLGKYLLPPSQHLKDEQNYDAACMYVVANWLNITAEDVKWILKAASKDNW